MLNKANDIVGQILLVVFFGLMGAVPLTVVILGIINSIRAVSRRGTIVLQVLASMAVWFFLTYAIVMIFIVSVYSFKYPLSDADNLKTTAIVIFGTLIYAIVGAALIFGPDDRQNSRQRRLMGLHKSKPSATAVDTDNHDFPVEEPPDDLQTFRAPAPFVFLLPCSVDATARAGNTGGDGVGAKETCRSS